MVGTTKQSQTYLLLKTIECHVPSSTGLAMTKENVGSRGLPT
jgi:hypothetical protein